MKQAWCTAQIWGAGPISKLASILTAKNLNVDFCYINSDRTHYDYFVGALGVPHKIDSLENLCKLLCAGDCLVSVMHSELAILAKILNLRVIYIDSLTWFWKIWEEVGDVAKIKRPKSWRTG